MKKGQKNEFEKSYFNDNSLKVSWKYVFEKSKANQLAKNMKRRNRKKPKSN